MHTYSTPNSSFLHTNGHVPTSPLPQSAEQTQRTPGNTDGSGLRHNLVKRRQRTIRHVPVRTRLLDNEGETPTTGQFSTTLRDSSLKLGPTRKSSKRFGHRRSRERNRGETNTKIFPSFSGRYVSLLVHMRRLSRTTTSCGRSIDNQSCLCLS